MLVALYLGCAYSVYFNSFSIIFIHRFHHNIISYLTFSLHTGRRHIEFACVFTFMFIHYFYGKANATGYISTKHSLPPMANDSAMVVQSSHFYKNSSQSRYFYFRDNSSMTFSFMVYMFVTYVRGTSPSF